MPGTRIRGRTGRCFRPFAAAGRRGRAADLACRLGSRTTVPGGDSPLEPGPRRGESRAECGRGPDRGGGLCPPAVLSGEIEDVPGGTDLVGAGIRLEIGREFLTGGRSATARALAASDVRVAEAALYATGRALTARTHRALVRILGGSAVARRLAAEDSLLTAAEASLRGRFSVGEARYTDVLRLRTERLRVQTDRAIALAEARVGRVTIETLVGPEGRPTFAALVDSVTAEGLAAPRVDELPPPPDIDSLVALSGEVRLADAALERARAARDVLLAEQQPRIAGSVGVQRVSTEEGGIGIGPTVGASVTLPFTARRANQAVRLTAERQVAAAEAARSAASMAVRADLSASIVRYEAARERLAVFGAALLRGAREERESALAAYRTGELSLIELLDFERALARAEIERVRARTEAAEALVSLVYGTNDPGPFELSTDPE